MYVDRNFVTMFDLNKTFILKKSQKKDFVIAQHHQHHPYYTVKSKNYDETSGIMPQNI